eukprot:TRINITY_DN12687_c0_g1_i1.p1 TRINITY_DN12687_c0_g1~~TRINITY_DN12687_c0_g1_i1.p1  ORF type:complete len:493 (-),score=83.02 TRINITY_DN12687_c0_g1_i1:572-2050(-)
MNLSKQMHRHGKRSWILVVLVACVLARAFASLANLTFVQRPSPRWANQPAERITHLPGKSVATAKSSWVAQTDSDEAQLPDTLVGSMHLAKSILGTGWLCLPAGVSALAAEVGQGHALQSALVLLAVCSVASAMTYREVAISADATNSGTFAQAYENSGAPGGNNAAATVCVLNCLAGCVSFAVLLGNVAESTLSNWAGLEPAPGFELVHRLAAVAIVVFGLLGPLCAKLDFKSMGWTSSLGITATVATALVMIGRFSDGTYMQPSPEGLGSLDAIVAETERARSAVHSAASSTQSNGFVVMCALLANSFTAHHTAPQLRQSMRSTGSSGRTEDSASFDLVIAGGFALSAAVYAVAIVCGYSTFGSSCHGNILDNYRSSDSLADVAKLATLASVVCSFPVMFLGLRDSLRDLLGSTQNEGDASAWLNPALLTIITLLAGCCKDLAEASACQGAILGCCLVYAMPVLMAASRHVNSDITNAPSRPSKLQARVQ